jgi:hypothetical protein
LQQAAAILGTRGTCLFKLDDMPANLPAGLYLDGVNGAQSSLAGSLNSSQQG